MKALKFDLPDDCTFTLDVSGTASQDQINEVAVEILGIIAEGIDDEVHGDQIQMNIACFLADEYDAKED